MHAAGAPTGARLCSRLVVGVQHASLAATSHDSWTPRSPWPLLPRLCRVAGVRACSHAQYQWSGWRHALDLMLPRSTLFQPSQTNPSAHPAVSNRTIQSSSRLEQNIPVVWPSRTNPSGHPAVSFRTSRSSGRLRQTHLVVRPSQTNPSGHPAVPDGTPTSRWH